MATVGRLKFVTLINPSGGGNNFPFVHVRNDTFEPRLRTPKQLSGEKISFPLRVYSIFDLGGVAI